MTFREFPCLKYKGTWLLAVSQVPKKSFIGARHVRSISREWRDRNSRQVEEI